MAEEGGGLRQQLRQDARGAFADCLEREMSAGRGGTRTYKACARSANIASQFRQAWQGPEGQAKAESLRQAARAAWG